MRLRLALLGTALITLAILALSFITLDMTEPNHDVILERKEYQVQRIDQGNLILVSPYNREDNRFVTLDEYIKFGVDVDITDVVYLFVDKDNTIKDMEVKK